MIEFSEDILPNVLGAGPKCFLGARYGTAGETEAGNNGLAPGYWLKAVQTTP